MLHEAQEQSVDGFGIGGCAQNRRFFFLNKPRDSARKLCRSKTH
jgi:hypothetical protein